MSASSRRELWRPWAKPGAPPQQIAASISETIASRTLDNHLQTAISEFAPPPTKEQPAMTTSPGSHALTIKDVLEEHGKKLEQLLQAQMAVLMATLDDQVSTVVKGTEAVIATTKGHTDDFKAILGQFTNNL